MSSQDHRRYYQQHGWASSSPAASSNASPPSSYNGSQSPWYPTAPRISPVELPALHYRQSQSYLPSPALSIASLSSSSSTSSYSHSHVSSSQPYAALSTRTPLHWDMTLAPPLSADLRGPASSSQTTAITLFIPPLQRSIDVARADRPVSARAVLSALHEFLSSPLPRSEFGRFEERLKSGTTKALRDRRGTTLLWVDALCGKTRFGGFVKEESSALGFYTDASGKETWVLVVH